MTGLFVPITTLDRFHAGATSILCSYHRFFPLPFVVFTRGVVKRCAVAGAVLVYERALF